MFTLIPPLYECEEPKRHIFIFHLSSVVKNRKRAALLFKPIWLELFKYSGCRCSRLDPDDIIWSQSLCSRQLEAELTGRTVGRSQLLTHRVQYWLRTMKSSSSVKKMKNTS